MIGILETIILIAMTIFFTLALLLCSIVIYKLIKDILKDLKKESDNKWHVQKKTEIVVMCGKCGCERVFSQ